MNFLESACVCGRGREKDVWEYCVMMQGFGVARFSCLKGLGKGVQGCFFFFSRTRYIDFLKEILCLGILS